MRKANEVLASVVTAKPKTGAQLLDALAKPFGLTGRELFEEAKKRKRDRHA